MTLRDDIWDETLVELVKHGQLKISDLSFDESKRHTVRRVFNEMDDLGWLQRESSQAAIYRLGPKAEMVLSVSSEVIKESRP